MIEEVIDEILAAEREAQLIVKEANDKVAQINLAAARISETVKQEYAEKFKIAADRKRTEAENKGDAEAEKLLASARAEAENVKKTARERTPAAERMILDILLNGN